MEWIENVNADARVAYLLALTEKIIDKIENEKGYLQTRKTIDMCWDWAEEKKHSGDELYDMFDNEEGFDSIDDPQEEAIWFSIGYAIAYAIWQAYQYENEEYVPQPIEIVDDSTIDEFMSNVRKIHGYDENWARALREYLLAHYTPEDSDKKIKRSEILSRI